MKKSILSLLVLAFAAMTSTTMAQEIHQGAVIEFEKDVHDYGEIPYMGNGTYSFVFKNEGSEPLVISNAKGSCGCTVPSWPKEPIAPGASGTIEVTYDTKRVGGISKSVTITSNAVNTPIKVIRITGTVLEQAQEVPPVRVELQAEGAAEVLEEAEDVIEVVEVEKEVAPMTKEQLKAEKKRLKKEAKAEKKRLKAEAKARKKALKAEAKKAA